MPEESKQNHRNGSAAKPPYSWRVLIIYSLFGAPVGTMLFILFTISSFDLLNLRALFSNMPIIILVGYAFGGISAVLTGLLAMLLRLKRNLPGIAAVTAIGALLSTCVAVMFNLGGELPFMVIGAAAAFVLSACLPKPAE
ncbi:hypothetical protein H9Q10_00760 [Eikenella sp. S3360]|uniref:Uncharacterized protein n=1 Tax=Eikenella glucosivorans TaxID=2766967 RepID=A0ABS0N7B8_9NEIS|nr:hypothetical protein [Eikenella glucosivorans]MBH5328203.1 hypothetical protein [Eikenella glucosivorans]